MMVELESTGIKVNLVTLGSSKTNLNGYPIQTRAVTEYEGLYFLGYALAAHP
jgi:hypothetical protein